MKRHYFLPSVATSDSQAKIPIIEFHATGTINRCHIKIHIEIAMHWRMPIAPD